MIIYIHLQGGRVIELNDRVFSQEDVNKFFQQIYVNPVNAIHYVETKGKNHIIPTDKILYIDTKFKV